MTQFAKGGPMARREAASTEFVKQRDLRNGEKAIRSFLIDRKAGTRKRSGGIDGSRYSKRMQLPRGSHMSFEQRQDALAPMPKQQHWSGSRLVTKP